MAIDLKKYLGNVPVMEKMEEFNSEEDNRLAADFNKKMLEVRKEFLAKEKRSCISAKKIVLTS